MKKRNLILIALAITTIMVFTQIGAMAKIIPMMPAACIIVPHGDCPICDGITGQVCHAGGLTCDAPNYQACCNWAQTTCQYVSYKIKDATNCGSCCN
mgnify:CR=1 FL=1